MRPSCYLVQLLKNCLFSLLILISVQSIAQLSQVTVNNATLNYLDKGSGDIILFVHGLQEDYGSFADQVRLLEDSYRVITYSRRYNFPNANTYETGTDFSDLTEANDLFQLISKLNVGPVNLIGHSYGGLIAMVFAIKNPELVKTLTLSEPALTNWLGGISGCEHWYDSIQVNLINKVRLGFERNDTTEVMKRLFEFFAGQDIQDQLPPGVMQSLKANLTEVKALVYSQEPFSPIDKLDLKALNVPIMILTTGNTMPLLDCTNKELRSLLPDARQYHLNDASHELWQTHPEVLSQYLKEFITEN